MAYSAKTERLISIKKLSGKAQTSNDKGLINEGLPSGLTVSFETVFGEGVPTTANQTSDSLYTILTASGLAGNGQVEYVRFASSFIAGTVDDSGGRQGFELKLPSDYESNSKNPLAGTYPYINDQTVNITSGSLQMIPPSFAIGFEARPFYGGTGAKDSGTRIYLTDVRDWYLDYFNGVMFQQDPPGAGDHSDNPDYVQGYLYIGNYLSGTIANIPGGGGGSITGVTAGTGLSGGGSSGNVTLSIDDSVTATISGSQFSGNVGVTSDLRITGSTYTVGDIYIAHNDTTGDTGALYFSDGSQFIKSYSAGTLLNIDGDNYVYVTADNKINFYAGESINFNQGYDSSLTMTFYGDSVDKKLIDMSSARNSVYILSGGAAASPDEYDYQDTSFFVSGSIGSKGTSTRGTSVFGGDVVISGTLHGGSPLDVGNETVINSDRAVPPDSVTYATFEVYGGAVGSSLIRATAAPDDKEDRVLVLSGGSPSSTDPALYPDMNFFVSGSIGTKSTSTKGTSVFGGDLVASGVFYPISGMSGSLTRLEDGTSYLVAGNNIAITTGSSGAVTIASVNDNILSRNKTVYKVISSVDAGDTYPVASSDFSLTSYNPSYSDVFLNGQLIISGTSSEISAGDADYTVSASTSVVLSFDLQSDDILTVVLYTT